MRIAWSGVSYLMCLAVKWKGLFSDGRAHVLRVSLHGLSGDVTPSERFAPAPVGADDFLKATTS
jgi:hypothetical protein